MLASTGSTAEGPLHWLERFLSKELRQASHEELSRGRVLAGAACCMLAIDILVGPILVWARLPTAYLVVTGVTLVGYVGTLLMLRWSSSSRPGAMLMCGMMAFVFLALALYENDNYLSSNALGMLITLVAAYLLGPRLALVILIPMVLCVGAVHPLWSRYLGLALQAPSVGYLWMMHVLAALCILAGWVIGWLYSSTRDAAHAALEQDIKARREAEAKLGELHHTLLDVSRRAGMSEIATGVLHNVGNTLNSVNISVGVLTDKLRGSRIPKLLQATELLSGDATEVATFLTTDPRGAQLPAYLRAVSEQLAGEREALLTEMHALSESVEHIKSVVSMQQRHARQAGVLEQVSVPQLIDDALRLDSGSFERLGIELRREYADVPPIMVDRHKLLQILLNLLSNARHALVESETQAKQLTIRVGLDAEEERLRIYVLDNGIGIAPENLKRMFSQGFTTKKQGHGFGLHISALAAQELQGRLSVESPGLGQGAVFCIELPLEREDSIPPRVTED